MAIKAYDKANKILDEMYDLGGDQHEHPKELSDEERTKVDLKMEELESKHEALMKEISDEALPKDVKRKTAEIYDWDSGYDG